MRFWNDCSGSSPKCDVFTREYRQNFEFGRNFSPLLPWRPEPYAGATGWLNATANLLREGFKVGTMFLILGVTRRPNEGSQVVWAEEGLK